MQKLETNPQRLQENIVEKQTFDNTTPENIQRMPPSRKGTKFSKKTVTILLAIIVIVIIGGAFFYIMKINPFSVAPYSENNLLSGILTAVSKIDSSGYVASVFLSVEDREEDAEPFVSKFLNTDELRKKYYNDRERAKDVSAIIRELSYSRPNYPSSLKLLAKNALYDKNMSIKDPVTELPYDYTLTEEGKNFALSVIFETRNAIYTVRKYNTRGGKMQVNGQEVIFKEYSSLYFYLPSAPPKPFLVEMSESMSYLPPETKVSGSIGAQSNKSDWKFNFDATGDFGDLAYKLNMDVLKKEGIYYFIINNMPLPFFGYIGIEKGEWIKVDLDDSQDGFPSARNFSEAEDYYKKHKKEIVDFLKKVVSIADQEKLIVLKQPVSRERKGGKILYKYDIELRKEAIAPFYERILEESEKISFKEDYFMFFADRGYLDYLQSPEFAEIFDYYQKNTSVVLWADTKGFPVIIDYSIRLVPADSVMLLRNKQVDLTFRLELVDINKPVDIQAPSDYKNIKDVIGMNPYIQKGNDATIKGNLSMIATRSAVYYDKNKSYNNWCFSEDFTNLKKNIEEYVERDEIVCACDTNSCILAKKWCVSARLSSGVNYCVDYSGTRIELFDVNVCSKGRCNNY